MQHSDAQGWAVKILPLSAQVPWNSCSIRKFRTDICLIRKGLPFCFEVWCPPRDCKARPLCQDAMKCLESKHDVSIVQPPFSRTYLSVSK